MSLVERHTFGKYASSLILGKFNDEVKMHIYSDTLQRGNYQAQKFNIETQLERYFPSR